MTAFVAFKVTGSAADISTSVGLAIVVNLAPVVFYFAVKRNEQRLSDVDTQKVIGSIYMGKNIDKIGHYAGLYPMAFFWRRTLFVIITVFLFEWPTM